MERWSSVGFQGQRIMKAPTWDRQTDGGYGSLLDLMRVSTKLSPARLTAVLDDGLYTGG